MTRKELTGIFTCFALLFFAAYAFAAPVPDTGQTKCYDVPGNVITCPSPGQALYGQDANYSINPMSFTKLDGSGNALLDSATSWVMVKDNVTGLVWEMKANKDGVKNYNDPHDADNTYTWYDSNPATNGGNAGTPGTGTDTEDFIKALNDARYGGYSDWRMPTIKELAYIVNYSIPYPGPTIDTGYFPNTAASWYWSSTTNADYTYYAWRVNFYDGDDGYDDKPKPNNYYVRAVRGGQSGALGYSVIWPFDTMGGGSSDDVSTATGGYADNGDGTVTDTSTGLMWQQQAGSSTQTWEQALAYCEGLNLGGHTDWRLPTFKELRSLVDYSLYGPAINATYFPNAAASWYWSSTTDAGSTSRAWGVYFSNGYARNDSKDANNYVRAVRGGQSRPLGPSVISVSPASRAVAKDAGATTFSVSNTGTGTMPWTATVTSGDSWLLILGGAIGNDSGTITCSFTANASSSARTATIRVTSTGATGSPVDVTVTQPTGCTATLDGNLMLHIPVLAYLNPWWGSPAFWAYFVYEYNPAYPALILFKMTNAGEITASIYSCKISEISTISNDLIKIHIPNVLLADGITLLSVDMEYSPAFSTNGNTCFVVTKYGVVPN
jgi:hypothetical protein